MTLLGTDIWLKGTKMNTIDRILALTSLVITTVGAVPESSAQLGGFVAECSNTLSCSASCVPGSFAITGYCRIPGNGENGQGALQNVGIYQDQWICTYEAGSPVKKIEVGVSCMPDSVLNKKD
jgi:hypothetical protein